MFKQPKMPQTTMNDAQVPTDTLIGSLPKEIRYPEYLPRYSAGDYLSTRQARRDEENAKTPEEREEIRRRLLDTISDPKIKDPSWGRGSRIWFERKA